MKITYTDLNEMVRELKEKGVHEIRVNDSIRDVQAMIPDDYPLPIKTFSVYVTAHMGNDWEDDLIAEYVERVGCADENASEDVVNNLYVRTQDKMTVLRELLAPEFLAVGSGRFQE
ncbi:MAG: hypothetical protein HOH43_24490 [Candidatus Latescibacteria bacterium]|nr:hypothetical protein [Candidatus Latescibacterota bacterium]